MDENTKIVLLSLIAAMGTGFGAWIGFKIGKGTNGKPKSDNS